jgi:peptidyl-prolyl cis-trans isomerase D
MLQTIRSKAGSLIVKILFATLILSFGIWGIGDIFRNRGASETTVASVGDTHIQADALQRQVRAEVDRMRSMSGGNFDMAQAKQLGIIDQVLNRIITSDIVEKESQHLDIAVNDQIISNKITSDPQFKGANGQFDRGIFDNLLAGAHLSEERYAVLLREEIARTQLIDALSGGVTVPKPLAEALYRTRNEKRVADYALLPTSSVKDVGTPTDEQLADFVKAHEDMFRAPEYRSFTLLVLQASDLAAKMKISDDKLKDAYQAHLSEFQVPERRNLQVMLLPDEAKAKEAEAQLAAGKDFLKVAKELGNQEPDAVNMGWTKRDDIADFPEVAAAAFGSSVKEGALSQPLPSILGWHIVKVLGIEAGYTKTFEVAKPELASVAAKDLAADDLYKLSNKLDDALAGGASIEEVATKFDLKPRKIDFVDSKDKTPSGGTVDMPAAAEVLPVAFKTAQGETTRLNEAKTGEYFVLRVDTIKPSEVRPMAEIRKTAQEMWQEGQRKSKVEAQAREIVAAVTPQKNLAAVAQEKHLTLTTSPPLTRNGEMPADLTLAVASKLFTLKPGETTVIPSEKGAYVVALKEVVKADPAADKDKNAIEEISAQIQSGLRRDFMTQYTQALRERYPVTIDQQKIDTLF